MVGMVLVGFQSPDGDFVYSDKRLSGVTNPAYKSVSIP